MKGWMLFLVATIVMQIVFAVLAAMALVSACLVLHFSGYDTQWHHVDVVGRTTGLGYLFVVTYCGPYFVLRYLKRS